MGRWGKEVCRDKVAVAAGVVKLTTWTKLAQETMLQMISVVHFPPPWFLFQPWYQSFVLVSATNRLVFKMQTVHYEHIYFCCVGKHVPLYIFTAVTCNKHNLHMTTPVEVKQMWTTWWVQDFIFAVGPAANSSTKKSGLIFHALGNKVDHSSITERSWSSAANSYHLPAV